MISWKTFIFVIFLLKITIVEGTKFPVEIFVAFSMRVPFVYRSQTGESKGLDIMIIKNFARKLKFNVKYVEYNISFNEMFSKEETFANFLLNRKLQWVILSKLSFNFCINSFNYRKLDIFIGALDENIITNEYFDASHPYYHDSLIWCARERKPIAKWKNFFSIM